MDKLAQTNLLATYVEADFLKTNKLSKQEKKYKVYVSCNALNKLSEDLAFVPKFHLTITTAGRSCLKDQQKQKKELAVSATT